MMDHDQALPHRAVEPIHIYEKLGNSQKTFSKGLWARAGEPPRPHTPYQEGTGFFMPSYQASTSPAWLSMVWISPSPKGIAQGMEESMLLLMYSARSLQKSGGMDPPK